MLTGWDLFKRSVFLNEYLTNTYNTVVTRKVFYLDFAVQFLTAAHKINQNRIKNEIKKNLLATFVSLIRCLKWIYHRTSLTPFLFVVKLKCGPTALPDCYLATLFNTLDVDCPSSPLLSRFNFLSFFLISFLHRCVSVTFISG